MGLIRGARKGDVFKLEGVIDFPLFGTEIKVFVEEGASLEYAERCAGFLQNMDDALVEKLCDGCAAYLEETREAADLESDEGIRIPEGIRGREVLRYVQPSALVIEQPRDGRIALDMELNCDWEPEHGMEWCVLGGEALFVGAYAGESPWRGREYFRGIGWNYAALDD